MRVKTTDDENDFLSNFFPSILLLNCRIGMSRPVTCQSHGIEKKNNQKYQWDTYVSKISKFWREQYNSCTEICIVYGVTLGLNKYRKNFHSLRTIMVL